MKDAISSAVDVMQAMGSSMCSLLPKVIILSLNDQMLMLGVLSGYGQWTSICFQGGEGKEGCELSQFA